MDINVRLIHPDARLPYRAHPTDAGADLHCVNPVSLRPHERCVASTGIVLDIPVGFEGQIRPRSGLAANDGVTVLNAPGTIDSGYQGVVGVILINHGSKRVDLPVGARIAQLVIAPVLTARFGIEPQLPLFTERGAAGFGSTGTAVIQ